MSPRAWFELLRLPNLFTVPGDVLVGGAVVAWVFRDGTRDCAHWPSVVLTIAGSLLLYAAGLLLNDWFDAAVDARERPSRPIPSGRVREGAVLAVGVSCLIAGAALPGPNGWLVSVPLAAAILFYDAFAKNVPVLGVVVMGLCRALNVLLGAFALAGLMVLGKPDSVVLLMASGFAWVYTVLLSVVAHDEAAPDAEPSVWLRWSPFVLVAVLAGLFWWMGADTFSVVVPLVAAVLLVPVLRVRGDVPALVSGLIRHMIVLQGVWMVPFLPTVASRLVALAFVAAAYGVARLAARVASGS